jgi:hypothetical protein
MKIGPIGCAAGYGHDHDVPQASVLYLRLSYVRDNATDGVSIQRCADLCSHKFSRDNYGHGPSGSTLNLLYDQVRNQMPPKQEIQIPRGLGDAEQHTGVDAARMLCSRYHIQADKVP